MPSIIARIAAWIVFTVAALLGQATYGLTVAPPPAGNLSDHWWIPEENGWGLSLIQNDDRVLFGVLFVYDGSGRAQWFVMPDMRRSEGAAPSYSGALYSTSGSPVGTSFDPASMRVQQRGVATITPQSDGSARFRYNVDNTTVEKTVRRINFMPLPIEGYYAVRFAASGPSSCNGMSLRDFEVWRIRTAAGGYDISRYPIGGAPGTPSPMQGQQYGSTLIATFAEQLPPGLGTWTLVIDSVTTTAIVGKFTLVVDSPAGSCVLQGNVSGTRDLPLVGQGWGGYLSDHWMDPSQPGWGMSVSHGSFGLFAVLFHYSTEVRDAQGRGPAQWYVMPEMTPLPVGDGDPPPPPPGYRGPIYSAQGTPFSQPFDATATRALLVGEAAFGPFGAEDATLTYRIGDRTVTRQVKRLATAPLPTAGRFRVAMNPWISACGERRSVAETWEIEVVGDGAYRASRIDVNGNAIGGHAPVRLIQRGKFASLTFTSEQDGAAYDWTVNLDHAGASGLSGGYSRRMTNNTCFENGTFAGAREP